ncbi:hypothetical protein QBC38DRAFT_518197 [Podospora fimiseda]|uniref:Uncharacterized protein n=1 Tax=Podospora fimiseda TaxID=252190 RepID=A0AAN6YTZ9_9PEZI|nr:hypothetical protein QBC38DRAFT_518197 [Podospora fimiseda]
MAAARGLCRNRDKIRIISTSFSQESRKFPLILHDKFTYPDGAWIHHPAEICNLLKTPGTEDDEMTIEELRQKYHDSCKKLKEGNITFTAFFELPVSVDMSEMTDDPELVDIKLEKWFVNAPMYLIPGNVLNPGLLERNGEDWRWNARGVYYRHWFNTEIDWEDDGEMERRRRAKRCLKHATNNARWNKSEYGWEADTWGDIFGQIRDDPAVAADKHEYCTVRSAVHPVSCLQTVISKFIRRIPDATFGLATFQPKDCQNAANLVFPFAVYEAKGWSGDTREARHQACAAASVYLDLLDTLARQPQEGRTKGDYQTVESRSTQVFVITSFGAHWHVMVGYSRPRLAREHAGRKGVSDIVYLFQRIWSGRISTERKAWELLSIIDQIHEWLRTAREGCQWAEDYSVPAYAQFAGWHLPDWTEHFSGEALEKLKRTAGRLMTEAFRRFRGEIMGPVEPMVCVGDHCRVRSREEVVNHFKEWHGINLGDADELRPVFDGTVDTEDDDVTMPSKKKCDWVAEVEDGDPGPSSG